MKALCTSEETPGYTVRSPLKPRRRQNAINKVCRSHLYLLSAMNRISGLLKGIMLVLSFCISQNYSINIKLFFFYTKGLNYYTK
jgi:hypothetical protein